ncbi:MAG TPA: hypothetical protein VF228_02060 [Iamia sp.]
MSLHPTMKRRLHERLHPLIGEEEADALLDEIAPQDPVTREWLEGRFDRIDDRFERMEERFATKEHLDARLDGVKHELMGAIHSLEIRMNERFAAQTQWTMGCVVFIATVLTVAQIIWG